MSAFVSSIARKVEQAILDHDEINQSTEINVIEQGGVVTLQGKASDQKQLDLVESIAREVEGVTSVVNQMDVDPTLKQEDESLDLEEDTKVPPSRSGPHARG